MILRIALPTPAPERMTQSTLALAVAALATAAPAGAAPDGTAPAAAAPAASAASAPTSAAPLLEASTRLAPLPRANAARRLPIVLQARTLTSQPDLQTVAEGEVEFRRGGVVIRADRLAYDSVRDTARASGGVSIARQGTVYRGPGLEIAVQRFEGFFLQPSFDFTELGAGGRADRIDFLGPGRSRATNALYTSCPRVDSGAAGGEPDWVLKTDRVTLDLDANEGLAEGAQLRFLGVPIVALPALSFPLNDARKSGWLPPSINIDNRSGLVVSVPWYWNIAPNRDATLAPRIITRRGLGLDSEFRYLEPRHEGAIRIDALPRDQVARRSRGSLQWLHQGEPAAGWRLEAEIARVSDDGWWKDFPEAGRSFTPRLLAGAAGVERRYALPAALWAGGGEASAYARVLQWQVLQDPESFVTAPYERSPQVGLALRVRLAGGLELALETEFNRFTLPDDQARALNRPTGDRWHALGSVAWPLRGEGWFAVPRLSLNAAAYAHTERLASGLVDARRAIPTFSLDLGLELERSTVFFGRELRQTLEPRLLFVDTPYKPQQQLPNYDSAGKDFNVVSLFTDNAFSGVDRVSDARQLTAGFTSRLVDAASGAEALRLGLVQRVLLRPQRVAPQADGSPDGPTLEQRFSDALLVGSTSVLPGWRLDAAVQYSPDIRRSVRSILGARYSPGPYRTVGATYRLARGLSEQLEVGWQWPVWGTTAGSGQPASRGSGGGACKGAWYSVGRFNYSLQDRRLTDSVLGVEYDAGCWIARVVAEQLSTGRSQATTRILVQLELVGLSRLGSNPLKVLRDNISGYRLLRDDRDSGRAADGGPTP
jgi:LPS-assembly protein